MSQMAHPLSARIDRVAMACSCRMPLPRAVNYWFCVSALCEGLVNYTVGRHMIHPMNAGAGRGPSAGSCSYIDLSLPDRDSPADRPCYESTGR